MYTKLFYPKRKGLFIFKVIRNAKCFLQKQSHSLHHHHLRLFVLWHFLRIFNLRRVWFLRGYSRTTSTNIILKYFGHHNRIVCVIKYDVAKYYKKGPMIKECIRNIYHHELAQKLWVLLKNLVWLIQTSSVQT